MRWVSQPNIQFKIWFLHLIEDIRDVNRLKQANARTVFAMLYCPLQPLHSPYCPIPLVLTNKILQFVNSTYTSFVITNIQNYEHILATLYCPPPLPNQSKSILLSPQSSSLASLPSSLQSSSASPSSSPPGGWQSPRRRKRQQEDQ